MAPGRLHRLEAAGGGVITDADDIGRSVAILDNRHRVDVAGRLNPVEQQALVTEMARNRAYRDGLMFALNTLTLDPKPRETIWAQYNEAHLIYAAMFRRLGGVAVTQTEAAK